MCAYVPPEILAAVGLIPCGDDAVAGGRRQLLVTSRNAWANEYGRSLLAIYWNGITSRNRILSAKSLPDQRQTECRFRTAFLRGSLACCDCCLFGIDRLCDERFRTSCTRVEWSIGKHRMLSRCVSEAHRWLPVDGEAVGPGTCIRDEEHFVACTIYRWCVG
jgi:hypothetical protein